MYYEVSGVNKAIICRVFINHRTMNHKYIQIISKLFIIVVRNLGKGKYFFILDANCQYCVLFLCHFSNIIRSKLTFK